MMSLITRTDVIDKKPAPKQTVAPKKKIEEDEERRRGENKAFAERKKRTAVPIQVYSPNLSPRL